MSTETNPTPDAEDVLDYREVAFWDDRYTTGRTNWDIGQPAPPLVAFAPQLPRPLGRRLACLGCGRGHDALFFAELGWSVAGFDFSEVALRYANERAASHGLLVDFQRRDLFTLDGDYRRVFDVVVEHTCFCAIDPNRRDDYVAVVRELLKPGGFFVGLFYAILPEDGPPFPTSADELRRRFAEGFEEQALFVPDTSVEGRAGRELLAVFRRTE